MTRFTVIEKETQTVVATNTWVVEAKDEKEAHDTYIEKGFCVKQRFETVDTLPDCEVLEVRPTRKGDGDDLYMVIAAIKGNDNLEVIDFNLSRKEAMELAFETEKRKDCETCKVIRHEEF